MFYFGGKRAALQQIAPQQNGVITYLHGDHLGSTSVASNASGALVARQTYFPYGAPRTSEGALPTDYTFTGQRADASAGLMFYNARYYDAALGRFTQPDLLIPNLYNPQALNRYAYVYNNPLKYIDPTGHIGCQSYDDGECADPPPPPPPCVGLGCEENKPPELPQGPNYFRGPLVWVPDPNHPPVDPIGKALIVAFGSLMEVGIIEAATASAEAAVGAAALGQPGIAVLAAALSIFEWVLAYSWGGTLWNISQMPTP